MFDRIGQCRRAVVVEKNGVTYAYLGYNGISDDWDAAGPDYAGTAPLVDWMVIEDIQREVAAGHIVIPFFHWGTEYVYDPTDEQRYFAQIAIDTGAAVVMGSHPTGSRPSRPTRGGRSSTRSGTSFSIRSGRWRRSRA